MLNSMSYNGHQTDVVEGSQNFKSRSRDHGHVPFVLKFYSLRKVATFHIHHILASFVMIAGGIKMGIDHRNTDIG